MHNIDVDELRARKQALKYELEKYQEAIDQKLARGEFDIDNMCGRMNQLEKTLIAILERLKKYDDCSPELQSEQDRKAIAIIGGGRGVEIRAKNDDATKYTVKKRKTYSEVLAQQVAHKSNGHSKQQQPQTITP